MDLCGSLLGGHYMLYPPEKQVTTHKTMHCLNPDENQNPEHNLTKHSKEQDTLQFQKNYFHGLLKIHSLLS
jgi:hypothetical protein